MTNDKVLNEELTDKSLLLELTRELIDLQIEKKEFNKAQNTRIKDVNLRIAQVVKEEN